MPKDILKGLLSMAPAPEAETEETPRLAGAKAFLAAVKSGDAQALLDAFDIINKNVAAAEGE